MYYYNVSKRAFFTLYILFVCDPLNLYVEEEDCFSYTVIVCDPSPMFFLLRIVFSLVNTYLLIS